MEQTASPNSDDTPRVQTVMQRKAQVGSDVRQVYGMSLAKALRLSLAKVAEQQMGLAVAVIGATVTRLEQDKLAALVEGSPLMMLLDGSGLRRGAAVFDAELVGALIQQQTMGKVTKPFDSGVGPRPMTDTDAAICAPYIDAFLAQAAGLPDESRDRDLLEGYQFGARVEGKRLLLMALEAPTYRVVQLTLDLAGGARQGRITLCLPERRVEPGEAETEVTEEGASPAPPRPKLETIVMDLKVDLHVALTSLTMPLGAVQGMTKGDVFDLGITAFDQARVQTVQGRRLGIGVLGQINGSRALQLEHSKAQSHLPRRRATDRDTLNLPDVAGDGTGTQLNSEGRPGLSGAPQDPGTDLALSLSNAVAEREEPTTLPDMSDLQGLDGLPTLDGLPDMSDLPGFDMADLDAKTGTG